MTITSRGKRLIAQGYDRCKGYCSFLSFTQEWIGPVGVSLMFDASDKALAALPGPRGVNDDNVKGKTDTSRRVAIDARATVRF
jgi:hypothetical protein